MPCHENFPLNDVTDYLDLLFVRAKTFPWFLLKFNDQNAQNLGKFLMKIQNNLPVFCYMYVQFYYEFSCLNFSNFALCNHGHFIVCLFTLLCCKKIWELHMSGWHFKSVEAKMCHGCLSCSLLETCFLQHTPATKRARLRAYFAKALVRAYQAVKEGLPVYRAAREYAVPLTTLSNREDNRVSADCTKSGPEKIWAAY